MDVNDFDIGQKKAAAGFAPANSDFADRRLSYLAIPPQSTDTR